MIFFSFSFNVFVYCFTGPDDKLVTGVHKTMFDMTEEMSDLRYKRMPGKSLDIFFLTTMRTKLVLYFRLAIATGNRHKNLKI
jgi:hypothetical protein